MKAIFEVDLSDKSQVSALIGILQGVGAPAVAPANTPSTSNTPAVKKAKATPPAPPAATVASKEDEPEITLASLRELTSQKAGDHRAAIKTQLAKYGASNVSSIEEKYFADYKQFLEGLK